MVVAAFSCKNLLFSPPPRLASAPGELKTSDLHSKSQASVNIITIPLGESPPIPFVPPASLPFRCAHFNMCFFFLLFFCRGGKKGEKNHVPLNI